MRRDSDIPGNVNRKRIQAFETDHNAEFDSDANCIHLLEAIRAKKQQLTYFHAKVKESIRLEISDVSDTVFTNVHNLTTFIMDYSEAICPKNSLLRAACHPTRPPTLTAVTRVHTFAYLLPIQI